jgi:3-oxoacyl-[acyl-carrier protein] reductase
MNLDLSGKNALVGGSSRGIGKATALELAELGANVTLMSRSADTLSQVVRELDTSKGQSHNYITVDFSEINDLRQKIQALTQEKTIHILVNNTGGPAGGPILESTVEEFSQALNNHLLCNQVLAQAVVPGMRKAGYGRIINVISTSVKSPINNLGVSNTTRAAVANWAKTLANEVGKDAITVNNLLPGSTNTERLRSLFEIWSKQRGITVEEMQAQMESTIPLGRIGEAHEIGGVIAFLASPAASYITGTNITVDGGRTKML